MNNSRILGYPGIWIGFLWIATHPGMTQDLSFLGDCEVKANALKFSNDPLKGNNLMDNSTPDDDSPTTEVLFDGKTLENFRGYQSEQIGSGWSVQDGAIFFDGNRSDDLVTRKEYGNFEFEFEWKISAGGNSGVMYRVSLGEKKPWHTGPEYQLLDDANHKDGKTPNTSTGALYALYPPNNKSLKPVGQWNASKIVLDGNRIEHWLNGSQVVEATIGNPDWIKTVEASKFGKFKQFAGNAQGHLVLQDHGNPVWFRNLKIKTLDE